MLTKNFINTRVLYIYALMINRNFDKPKTDETFRCYNDSLENFIGLNHHGLNFDIIIVSVHDMIYAAL